MTNTITIINPCGSSSLKKAKRKTSNKGKLKMATKRKRRKKSSVKRKRTRSKAKRRRNPKAKPHRITVYRTRKGGKMRLRRSKKYRLKPRRVNPKFKGMIGKYFGKNRMGNAIALLAGIGGGALSKTFAVNMVTNPMFSKFYGLLSIVAGATLNMRGRRKIVKSVGTGFVAFGVYDLLVENVPMLKAYLPSISGPTFLTQNDIEAADDVLSGGMNYGRNVMGASINSGSIQTVGSSINLSDPEIISSDIDIADALEMSLD